MLLLPQDSIFHCVVCTIFTLSCLHSFEKWTINEPYFRLLRSPSSTKPTFKSGSPPWKKRIGLIFWMSFKWLNFILLLFWLQELKKRDIIEVVRVCNPTYETKLLEDEGIEVLVCSFICQHFFLPLFFQYPLVVHSLNLKCPVFCLFLLLFL